MNQPPTFERIEPEAASLPPERTPSMEQVYLASIAISLKRIADAMRPSDSQPF